MKHNTSNETAAFLRGKDDYAAGVPLTQCPYPKGGGLASHWIEGYQMAAYEERQQTGANSHH